MNSHRRQIRGTAGLIVLLLGAFAFPAAAQVAGYRSISNAKALEASEAEPKAAAWQPGQVLELSATSLVEGSDAAWSGWLSNAVRAHAVPVAGSQSAALRLVMRVDHTASAQAAAAMLVEMTQAEHGEAARLVRESGWKFGATTAQGTIAIEGEGPADEQSVRTALRALSTMLHQPHWTPAGFTRWRERTRASLDASKTDTRAALNRTIDRVLGLDHADHALDRLSAADVERWLARSAADAPMTVAVAGPIDRAATMEQLGSWIGGVGGAGTKIARPRLTAQMPPAWDLGPVERVVGVSAVPGTRALVLRGIAGPQSSDIAASRRLRAATGLLEHRARRELEERGIEVSLLSSGMIFGDRQGGRSLLWVVAEAEPESVPLVREGLDAAVTSLAAQGPDEQPLELVKTAMAEQLGSLVSSAGYWADRVTASDLTGLELASSTDLASAYAAITGEQIAETIRSLDVQDRRLVITVMPQRSIGGRGR